MKNFVIIYVLACLCLSGCQEDRSNAKKTQAERIDTPAGMIKYLQRRRLPALKSVKVWENPYGPGLKLSTAHYDVYTTLLEPLMLSEVPGFIESAYRGYQNQLPKPIATVTRFTVYLFGERRQWEDYTDSFAGRAAAVYKKIKKGAYYLNGACVAYNIGIETTFTVIGHEGWHQFNSRHFKYRLPSWLDEGVAMLFEAYEERKGLFYFEPSMNFSRLGSLRLALARNETIPLRKLIVLNPGEVIHANQTGSVAAFYSQSYALVRFLRENDYGRRLGNYHRLMMGGLKGNWQLSQANKKIAADRNVPQTIGWNRTVGLQLFEQYIDGDIDKIEKEYIKFCRKIVYHVRFK